MSQWSTTNPIVKDRRKEDEYRNDSLHLWTMTPTRSYNRVFAGQTLETLSCVCDWENSYVEFVPAATEGKILKNRCRDKIEEIELWK
jgi:hypothetical protein